MTAPTIPALVLTFVLTMAAALATGPSAHHDSHHPTEMTGTMGALGRVAASLALRWSYPR